MASDRLQRIATFDADDGEIDVPQADDQAPDVPARRGRGRPPGAKGRTTRLDTRLQTSDFYFLRAVFEGISPKKAADRYLAQRGAIEGREAATLARDLLLDVAKSIESLKDTAALKQAREAMAVIKAPAQATVDGPTLEEFARQFDDGMYSERELLALYEDEYGVPPGTDVGTAATAKRKVESINWLMTRLAAQPVSREPCALWLDAKITAELRHVGVVTLGDLVAWINLTGRRWYDRLKGVGRSRAARLISFLAEHEPSLGVKLSPRVRAGMPHAEHARSDEHVEVLDPPGQVLASFAGGRRSFDVVPMESLNWPATLMGENGAFRGQLTNTYEATNDIEAVRGWFESIKSKSPATLDSYRRAIERLVLWAVLEKEKALSSLSTNDFAEFVDFLRAPPAHWCSRLPAMRSAPEWRPLRGPMKEISVRQTMSAIGSMYSAWLEKGYLRANAVPSSVFDKSKTHQMDVSRSFAVEDLDLIRLTLDDLADGMERRRLRAIILLLQTSGLRRSEAAGLTWGQLSPIRVDHHISEMLGAKFKGKGGKERTVPIHEETVRALEEHYQDRQALIAAGRLRFLDPNLPRAETPLLSVLDDRLTRKTAGPGMTALDAPRDGNRTGRLSSARMYGLLKAFFKKVAQRPEMRRGNADFLKASTHWLRHTFAHQALQASKGDLPTVQEILGHKAISTTGIYLKADLSPRAAAVRAINPAV